MTHLQFKLELCEALLLRCIRKDPILHDMVPNKRLVICIFSYSEIRKLCEATFFMLQIWLKMNVFKERMF